MTSLCKQWPVEQIQLLWTTSSNATKPHTCMYARHPLPCIPSLNFIIILIIFSYAFFVVTFAAVAIFSYAFLVPTALWGVLLWRKSNAGYSFLEILCVYGYSLFIYIPISVSFTTFLQCKVISLFASIA